MKKEFRISITGDVFAHRLYEKCSVNFSIPLYQWNLAQEIAEFLRHHDKVKLILAEDKPKRSLDANAYAWVLIGQLAEYYGMRPVEVYKQQIIGTPTYTVVPIRKDAVDSWIENWESHGIGWICVSLGQSKFPDYENIQCYRGSSSYDSAEMSQLIDNLIQECKQAEIAVDEQQAKEVMEHWKVT